jgi:hypothetical protein
MGDDIQNLFFSQNNQDFTYDLTRNQVMRHHDYDINKNVSFKQNYQKMALIVYNNIGDSDKNLVNLNNTLVEKSTQHFNKAINTKKLKKSQMLDKNDLSSGMTSVQSNRFMPSELSQPQQHPQQQNTSRSQPSQQQQGNILPFTLNDEFASQINSSDAPIYPDNNYSNTNTDPMKLMNTFNQDRDSEMQRFQSQLNKKNNSSNSNTSSNNSVVGNLGGMSNPGGAAEREFVMADTKIDLTAINPLDLYKKNDEFTDKMLNTMEENKISGTNLNDRETEEVKNQVQDYSIQQLVHRQPEYLEKEHYITINSLDRNWFENTTENQYNFMVNFRSSSDKHASVASMMKNIISIELINTNIPIDPIIIPFDTRLYLDSKSHPYLLLQIKEISGVFKGTNSNITNSFAQLIFDKEHSSTVISSEYINDLNGDGTDDGGIIKSIPKVKFSTQYHKGFYRYIPSFFEKKQFYNQPLASLGQMTIRLTDPDGELVNNQPDVLSISAITSEGISELDISKTSGFPNTTTAEAAIFNIKISTTNHFSNKQYKIGDKILIKGVVSTDTTTSQIVTFLNREEGHIIVNLEKEDNTLVAAEPTIGNKSFIQNMYIPQPGKMDSSNEALDTATALGITAALLDDNVTFTNAKLINKSLQTNLTFKIVTRDVDVQTVIKPQNT